MLTMKKLAKENIVSVEVSGVVTADDYEAILPQLEEWLKEEENLGFFILLKDVTGISPGAVWEDLKFDVKYGGKYGRTAMVGDKQWHEWMTKFSKVFFPMEIRYFDVGQADEAWKWLKEKEDVKD